MGLKIRGGKCLANVFGFAEHKTFVEYFGVTEFAKPQTKTRSGLSISIHPCIVQRLEKGGEERWEGCNHPLHSPLMPLAVPFSLGGSHTESQQSVVPMIGFFWNTHTSPEQWLSPPAAILCLLKKRNLWEEGLLTPRTVLSFCFSEEPGTDVMAGS